MWSGGGRPQRRRLPPRADLELRGNHSSIIYIYIYIYIIERERDTHIYTYIYICNYIHSERDIVTISLWFTCLTQVFLTTRPTLLV